MKTFERIIVTNDLTDRGFYMTDKGLNDLCTEYNKKSFPVFYGHNYDDINQYIAHSCKGTAKKEKNKLMIQFNTLDTPNGQVYEKMLDDKVPMGYSVGIVIDEFEFDESSGLVNILSAVPYEFSATPIPTDENTFEDKFTISLDEMSNEIIAAFVNWDTAYINKLPNESFAVVEKDYTDGKITNKSARHLPFKDKNGKVDLPHLRNALARMNQIEAIGESQTSDELRKIAKKILVPYAKEFLPDSKWATQNNLEGDEMTITEKSIEAFDALLDANPSSPTNTLEASKVETPATEPIAVAPVLEAAKVEEQIAEVKPTELEILKKQVEELQLALKQKEEKKDTFQVSFETKTKDTKETLDKSEWANVWNL